MDFDKLSAEEIIHIYSDSIKELKKRNIIRTKNVLGELGEYLAISHYNNTAGLPKLQPAPIGTQNVDAMSRNGERYSIKSCTTNTTGVFYGLEPKGSTSPDKQAFEYVIICRFDNDYQLQEIYELDWESFLKHKRWHKRMTAWNLVLSKDLIADAKLVFKKGS